MSEPHIHRNLADKRKEIQAYIGSLERDLERARRDLSAIVATERVFQSKGSKVTAYMELAALFPRHALPDIVKAALATCPEGMATVDVANHIITAKNLDGKGRHLRRSVGYKVVQVLRRWEKVRKVARLKKVDTAIVWQFKP